MKKVSVPVWKENIKVQYFSEDLHDVILKFFHKLKLLYVEIGSKLD